MTQNDLDLARCGPRPLSAIEQSHADLAAMLTDEPSLFLRLYSSADEVSLERRVYE